jgi:multidrug efflux pump subunit AcrA (membrane-fusion protein)
MKRFAIVGVLAAIVLIAVLRVGTTEEVPTMRVERGTLPHRVTADGVLRATAATPIVIPPYELGALVLVEHAPDGSRVEAGQVIARFDRARAERNLAEATSELANAEARLRIEQIRIATSAADQAAAVRAAETALEDAQHPVDPTLLSRNQQIESSLDVDLARERLAQAKRAAATDRDVARSNLSLARIARDRAITSRERARTMLANVELRAPQAGMLLVKRDSRGDLPKPGARLWTDEKVAELPDPSHLEAELFVLEVDGNDLAEGQPVSVVVASQPDTPVRGVVTHVDTLAKPRDLRSPVQYLGVVVTFDKTAPFMKLGQRVRGAITLDHAAVIAIPRHAVFDEGGTSVVYRRDASGFTRVPVRLGAMTAGRVVVVEGLGDHAVIALRKPEGVR